MSRLPFVSFITINYNQAAVTCQMLDSTRLLTYRNFEVIVVDNASAEDPTPLIAQGNYEGVRVILSDKNLGFSGGNNVGIKAAKGDYYFFLNNDTVVTPDLLEQLLQPFQKDPTVGVVCPKIRFFDHPNVIQYAGYHPLSKYTGRTWAIGLEEQDHGQYDVSGPTHFAHGAAMMVKKEVLAKTGTWEESYFLYYEELDWSARIRRAGFQIYYQAQALIYHKESMSVGKANPMKVYYHIRNRLWFMRRNTQGWPLFVFCVYYFLLAVPKAFMVHLVKREWPYLKAIKEAIKWNWQHRIKANGSIDPPVELIPYRV